MKRAQAERADYIWLLIAVFCAALLVADVLRAAPAAAAGRVGVAGVLASVATFLALFWVGMGAWRRTVWACPFRDDTCSTHGARCARPARSAQHEDRRRS
jgi:hypothetical protein